MQSESNSSSTRFENQVALIVGAAHGIGKAIALRMAGEGAQVVIGDIDREAMAGAADEIRQSGRSVQTVVCDVRDRSQVNQMVEHAVNWRERIDILMYIAGICEGVPFIETDEELWDRTLDTNLKGAFLVARAVVPHMIKRQRGKLVFMASTNSWDGEALQAPYNASKAGLYLLAKTLARELGVYGITSNAVGPGFIRTRLTEQFLSNPEFMKKYEQDHFIPLGRLGLPEDVTGPATFLASRDADFVNGVLLLVDGGQLA